VKKSFLKVSSKRFNLSFVVLIFICVLVTTLLALDYGGTLRIAYKDEPSSLNPLIERSTISATLDDIIYDGLVTLTPSGRVLPRLADSWTVSEDGLVWIFHLNKKARFHDGVKLTSEDVKFTYESILKGNDYKWKTVFKNVSSIEVVDDYSVKVKLKTPGSNFLFGFCFVGVIPKHILGKDPYNNNEFNHKPIGTGPFKLEYWKSNKEILLTSNDKYFRGRPKLDHIKLLKMTDTSEIWRQLELGRIDTAYNEITAEDFKLLKRSPIISIYPVKDYMNYAITFNFKKKIFQDKRMRTAFSAAIDRKEIIDKGLGGNGVECNGVFSTNSIDSPSENPYDPEMSLKLLHEMGYQDTDNDGILDRNGKKLSFKLLYDSNNMLKKEIILIVQKQLIQIGVEIIGEEVPVLEIFNRVLTGSFELIFCNFSTYLDMSALSWHSDAIRAGYNLSYYRNKKVDDLFEKLMATRDKNQRKEIMGLIQEQTDSDVAGIFLFTRYNLIPMNKRIHGYNPNSDQFIWEMVKNFYIPEKSPGK
jgi:peptide/nickel transport system substrate-binding protein